MDEETAARIAEELEDSDNVDASRIEVVDRGDGVVLRGAVATPEEASVAALVAERFAAQVSNELQIDPNLREGLGEPGGVEEATPAENEILLGDTDPLSGPETDIETDAGRAFEENLPWEPPDEPHLAPTDNEYGGAASPGGPEPAAGAGEDRAADEVGGEDYAAADLTREELMSADPPALDPDRVQPTDAPDPDPVGVGPLGHEPPEGTEPMVEQVPGTPAGPGAVGEGTIGGGSLAGQPAPETGARGADTAHADPARSGTGGTMGGTGSDRGPQAREDEPLREEFPESGQDDR